MPSIAPWRTLMRFREGLEQNCAQESLVFEVGISSRRSTKLCAVRCGVEVSISLLFEPRLTASEWISISPSRKLYAVRCAADLLISLLFEAQLHRTFQQSFPQVLRSLIPPQKSRFLCCLKCDCVALCGQRGRRSHVQGERRGKRRANPERILRRFVAHDMLMKSTLQLRNCSGN